MCDLTEPTCKKCEKKGLECPGYGIRYRFTGVQTVSPSEIRPSSSTASDPTAPNDDGNNRRRPNLKWVDVEKPVNNKRKRGASSTTTTTKPVDDDDPVIEIPRNGFPSGSSVALDRPNLLFNLPPLLSHANPRTRLLFYHCNIRTATSKTPLHIRR